MALMSDIKLRLCPSVCVPQLLIACCLLRQKLKLPDAERGRFMTLSAPPDMSAVRLLRELSVSAEIRAALLRNTR